MMQYVQCASQPSCTLSVARWRALSWAPRTGRVSIRTDPGLGCGARDSGFSLTESTPLDLLIVVSSPAVEAPAFIIHPSSADGFDASGYSACSASVQCERSR